MIRNPIIHKEVLSSLRTNKAYLMQAMFLLITAALVLLYWPDGGLQDVDGYRALRIFRTLTIGELVLVILFAPAFTAASITGEREHNTWESLYVTTLRPWQIAAGKMVGSLAFLVLLVVCGAIPMALPMILGGVSGGELLAAILLMILTALYLGMIGMLVSVLMHRSYRAIIVTYAILLFVCFFMALPVWPVSSGIMQRGGPIWQGVFHVIASFSPLQAMLSLVWPNSAYSAGAHGMPAYWILYIPIALVTTAAIAAYSLYRLHRPIAPPRPREGLRVVERGQISARSFLFLIDPRKRKRPISWWQNTVLAKEFRTRPMLQAHWLIRAVLACVIAAVLLMFAVAISVQFLADETINMVQTIATFNAAMMIILLLVVGPAISGGSVCADRETGVWDLMRTTRLSSRHIVVGKFLSSILPMVLLALATAPSLAILLYFDTNIWPNVLRICAVAGMSILFVSTAGTFFSSIFKRTATATAWTYAVVVLLGLVSLMVLLDQEIFAEQFIRGAFLMNPVAAAMDAAGNARMQQYTLFHPHLQVMAVLTGILLVLTVIRVYQLRQPD
jgi:ABC-type transport system involved in multi-copper enzyme maturation permease subunit